MNENKGFFAKLKEIFASIFGSKPKQLEEGPSTVEAQIADAQAKAIEEQNNPKPQTMPEPEVNPIPGMEENVQEFMSNQEMSREAMSQEMSLDDILGPEEPATVDTVDAVEPVQEIAQEEPAKLDEIEEMPVVEDVNVEQFTEEAPVEEIVSDNPVAVKETSERDDLLSLQKMFSDGAIEEDELTTEQVQKLHALYDEQIADLQKQIEENRAATEDYKQKIINIKRQLKTA